MREILEEAREKNSPELVIKAYTYEQNFTRCLNNHLAANSHHFLKLYCTIQNCPILNRTQEYTEAFTTILTHPKLDQYFVSHRTVLWGNYWRRQTHRKLPSWQYNIDNNITLHQYG